MRRVSMLMPAILLTCALVAGCEQAPKTAQSSKTASLASRKVLICAKCGQIEGSSVCCKGGQKLCSKCGLVKDSPGCCRLPKDTKGNVELCTKCGFIKGSADCCKTARTQKCSHCGLVKGSPGCCKIK